MVLHHHWAEQHEDSSEMTTSKEMLQAGIDPIETFQRVIEQAESGPANTAEFRAIVRSAAALVLLLLEPSRADTWDPDDYRSMLGSAINLTLDWERRAAGELTEEQLGSATAPPTDGPPPVH